MYLPQNNQKLSYLNPNLAINLLFILSSFFIHACEEPNSNDTPETCEEMELSPSQVCQQSDMTLVENGECDPMGGQFCQSITYGKN